MVIVLPPPSLWGSSSSFAASFTQQAIYSNRLIAEPRSTPRRISAVVTEPKLHSVTEQLDYRVYVATSPAELAGAANLRSHSFYSYPEDRSPMFVEKHRSMRAQDELRALTAKVAGKEFGFRRVACVVAACSEAALLDRSSDLDPSSAVAADDGRGPRYVIGTLDVNIGLRLPGEELSGRLPQSVDAGERRAYLSNVCVARAARRRGVGAKLVVEACSVAKGWGVEHLYVHVIADNTTAKDLYVRCGFDLEQEETSEIAHLLARPRRLLLHMDL
eukprot:jgi/Mesen1/2209/ME000152S01295